MIEQQTGPDVVSIPLGEDYTDIRDGVRQICKGFPGQYWQKLDEEEK